MSALPSGLPETIADEEDLARFLTQSDHFSGKVVKPAAFLPSKKDRETSVSRHGPLPLESLWSLGIEAAGERKLYGAAIFKARVAREVNLHALPCEPPPFHSVITHWPWSDDLDWQRAKQKSLALEIAARATLVLRGELISQ
jgi:hypothetical protein